jgi:hypothetical protein
VLAFLKTLQVRHIAILLASVYLFVGLAVLDHYGISYDEEPQRLDNGLVNYLFITGENREILRTGNEKYHGPAFEILLTGIEKAINFKSIRHVYLMRHGINFLTFFMSGLAMFLLAKALFASDTWGLFASLLYGLSPRFFAESFYNSKDMIFLAFFTFSLLTLYQFSRHVNFRWAVIHALVTGVLIDVRILGVIIPVSTVGFLFAGQYLSPAKRINYGRFALIMSVYTIAQIISITAFWPILWDGPFHHLKAAFMEMSNYHWQGTIKYLGKELSESNLPWHYLPMWIVVTIPITYQLLALTGAFIVLKKLFPISKKSFDEYKYDWLFLLLFVGPLVLIIGLNSIVYDGWRHIYFLYAPLVLLATRGAIIIKDVVKPLVSSEHSTKVTSVFFIAVFSMPVADVIRYHPFEYVYFNSIARKLFAPLEDQFEMDYWGLSYRQGFEYIVAQEQESGAKVIPENLPGYINSMILPISERERLIFMGEYLEKGIYFLANHRGQINKKLPVSAKESYQITTPSGPVLRIYKTLHKVQPIQVIHTESMDFEESIGFTLLSNAPSGRWVNKVGGENNYGYNFTFVVDSFYLAGLPSINVSGKFKSLGYAPNVRSVVSIERNGTNVHWENKWLGFLFYDKDAWLSWNWNHPQDSGELRAGDKISVYLWSTYNDIVYQDDVTVTFLTYSTPATSH